MHHRGCGKDHMRFVLYGSRRVVVVETDVVDFTETGF